MKINAGTIYPSGEFRITLHNADGSIKFRGPLTKNLFLENGLKSLLRSPGINAKGEEYQTYAFLTPVCMIGEGSVAPKRSDTALQNFAAFHTSILNQTFGRDGPGEKGCPNGFVRLWRNVNYIFKDMPKSFNIKEVGLGQRISNDNYYLVTRALIKDAQGLPLTVTVMQGEYLEVEYKVNWYIDVRRTTGSFQLKNYDINNNLIKTDTFDYLQVPCNVIANGEYMASAIANLGIYSYKNTIISTFPVNEELEDLNKNYSFNQEKYGEDKFNYLGMAWDFSNRFDFDNTSNFKSFSVSKPGTNQEVFNILEGFTEGKVAYRYDVGTQYGSWFKEKKNHGGDTDVVGIRGLVIPIYIDNGGKEEKIFDSVVFVKNRENGYGIMKTPTLRIGFSIEIKADYWENVNL